MFRLQILLLALLSASAPAGIHAHADQTVDGVALRPSGDVPDERDSLEQLTGRLDTLVRTSLNELYLNIDGRCEARRLIDELKILATKTAAFRQLVSSADSPPATRRRSWRDVVGVIAAVRFMIEQPDYVCARETGFMEPYQRIRRLEFLIFQSLMNGN